MDKNYVGNSSHYKNVAAMAGEPGHGVCYSGVKKIMIYSKKQKRLNIIIIVVSIVVLFLSWILHPLAQQQQADFIKKIISFYYDGGIYFFKMFASAAILSLILNELHSKCQRKSVE